ncbi:MAG: hypothetical protein ACTSX1_00125, partial [Candidatus Heimdallarchaeaceae archaeon]
IPDLMPEVQQSEGIWARPANNPLGGRNMENDSEHHFMGSSYIPKIGSWLFVFFESGNINRPYYFGALDLENTKVLPENQLGSNYEDKWTILKTHEGRTIIISDDPDDARTELTGKKREMLETNEAPTGDIASVYKIDDNQTTILFDERAGKEKILIRTVKGDFFHIDIDEQELQAYFKNDIKIKSDKNIYITAKQEIHIASEKSFIRVKAEEDIDIFSKTGDIFITGESGTFELRIATQANLSSGDDFNILSGGTLNYQSGSDINGLAGGNMNLDAGGNLNEQSGAAGPAAEAISGSEAELADPKGERDT